MARPYQFSDPDKVISPLDRRAPVTIQPSEAPAAFKQNMNRNKTKKWVDAKSYAYDGDDWGDYDEDDEYGTESQPPAQSSTLPRLQRPRSFERGDETRTFSATTPATASGGHQPFGQPIDQAQQHMRAVSGHSMVPSEMSELSSVAPEHRRDFSPSAMVPPLSARTGTESPAASVTSPSQRPPSSAGAYDPRETSTAVPFVRPADIYKRIEAAKSKESLAKASDDKLREAANLPNKPSLANIPERQPEYGVAEDKLSQDPSDKQRLPSIVPGSEFGDSMWSPTSAKSGGEAVTRGVASPTTAVHAAVVAAAADPSVTSADAPSRAPSKGFKSMVTRAFEPSELLGGVSKQDSIRSQRTDASSHGTADISPILASVRESVQYPDDDFELVNPEARSALPTITTTEEQSKGVENVNPSQPATLPVAGEVSTKRADNTLLTRPKIPGQFDSYAFASDDESSALKELPGAMYSIQSPKESIAPSERMPHENPSSAQVPDLSPSTTTKPMAGSIDPAKMTDLSAAGAAMGAALEKVFKTDPPHSSNVEKSGAEHNTAVPPAPPAKDNLHDDVEVDDDGNEEDDDFAPPVPLKSNRNSGTNQATGAVLESTAMAPAIATAQTVTLSSPKATKVSATEPTADRLQTSMLDIGGPVKEPNHPQPSKPVIAVNTDAPPQIKRQFSWETDTPAESVAPITSPDSPEGLRQSVTLADPGAVPSNLIAGGLMPGDVNLTSATIQGPVSPLEPEFHDDPGAPADNSEPQPRPVERNERLPSFREIMAIKSNTERTSVFNTTRKEWLAMNSGLDQWLVATLDKHPEHSELKTQATMPYDGPVTHGHSSFRKGHLRLASIGTISKVFSTTGGGGGGGPSSGQQAEYSSPDREKRISSSGASKAVGDTLKGLGDRSKGLMNKIKASRKKDDDGY